MIKNRIGADKMSKVQLSSIEEFQTIVESELTFLVVKHSLTCPISKEAFKEYEKFTNLIETFPTFYLFVQDARSLSNYIAETYGVKHESPQAILFENHQVKWHASHWSITEANLQQAIKS